MKINYFQPSLLVIAIALTGCGGGSSSSSGDSGDSSDTPSTPVSVTNSAPTVNAGVDEVIDEGTEVLLSAVASDSDGTIASYAWVQTAGTTVTLSQADTDEPSFTAPLITAPSEELTFELTVTDDDGATASDSVTITVENLYSPLNDTGVTLCGDYAYASTNKIHDNFLDCGFAGAADGDGNPVPTGQDALFGRDADPELNDDVDGQAGFSFTKLDAVSGGDLDASASEWGCVRDNVTGLIWEAKTDDGGLRDKDHFYSWYNSTGSNDGGDPGYDGADASHPDSCATADRCDTEKFAEDINTAALCGYDEGWRLPTVKELVSIVDFSRFEPATDTNFFPNTSFKRHWTSVTRADSSGSVYTVYGDSGTIANLNKTNGVNAAIRLVRDPD